jgi:hypothetical protein
MLVAFSCKRRGTCPSCNARRMCNGAAHLVDHVIPDVPLRKWVLSVPFELRLLLAKRTDALNFVGRVFVKEVFRWQREQARRLGLAETQSGAVEWPQRFGGSLNLNVHYHVAVPDGVFTRSAADARAEFHRLPPPQQPDLEDIALNVGVRVESWLRRKKLRRGIDEALFNNETPEPSALDACLAGSLGMGELSSLPDGGNSRTDDALWALPKPSKASRRGGHCRGFDVHAGVVVSGSDREGRERLLRYCGRPPLSLERLSLTEDGMVAYRLRKPLGPTQTCRIMTPMQFLARVAALVPPPRCPLIRFHGVFAPHSSWRASVVPAAGEVPGSDVSYDHGCERGHKTDAGATGEQHSCAQEHHRDSTADAADGLERTRPNDGLASPQTGSSTAISAAAGNTDQGDHTDARIRRSGRIDWHALLQRVYGVDSLACRRCGGRLEFVSLVTDERTARETLESMGLPSEPPRVMPASCGSIDYDLPRRARGRGLADFDPGPPPGDWD